MQNSDYKGEAELKLMIKKIFLSFVFLMFCVSGFCISVSFQVLQHSENKNSVTNTTYAIEDEILNDFFNSGYIVSNFPATTSISNEQNKKLWKLGFDEAVEGSFDKFIQINLYFSNVTKNENDFVEKIDWKVVSIKDGKIIEEKQKKVEKQSTANNENTRLFAKDFADYIKTVIVK